jgi:hypothetical protein
MILVVRQMHLIRTVKIAPKAEFGKDSFLIAGSSGEVPPGIDSRYETRHGRDQGGGDAS